MPTDEELVDLYRNNRDSAAGQEAFTTLFQRHNQDLRDYIGSRLWSRPRVQVHYHQDDIVQAAWQKLWKSIDRFDATRGTVRSRLLCMARQILHDRHTKLAGRPDTFSLDATRGIAGPHHGFESIDHADLRAKVWAWADTLAAPMKEALCMVVVEGLTYRAASARSGTPASTLKKRISRLKAPLVEALADWQDVSTSDKNAA